MFFDNLALQRRTLANVFRNSATGHVQMNRRCAKPENRFFEVIQKLFLCWWVKIRQDNPGLGIGFPRPKKTERRCVMYRYVLWSAAVSVFTFSAFFMEKVDGSYQLSPQIAFFGNWVMWLLVSVGVGSLIAAAKRESRKG